MGLASDLHTNAGERRCLHARWERNTTGSAQAFWKIALPTNLIEALIENRNRDDCLDRLLYDKAGDSDPLRERLGAQLIDLICPHRKNRKRPPTQAPLPRRAQHQLAVQLPASDGAV